MSTEDYTPEGTTPVDGTHEEPQLGPQHFDPKDLRDPVFPGGRWLNAKIAKMQFGRNKVDAKYGAGAMNCRIEYQVFTPDDPDTNGRLCRPFPITTEYTPEGAPFAWERWCIGVGIDTRAEDGFTVDPMDWIGRDVQIKLDVIQIGEGMSRRKANRLSDIRLAS